MKPANNLASSRAASFFSVFFLAALLYPRGCHPPSVSAAHARDSPGREGLHFPGTLGLVFTKPPRLGEWLAVPLRLRKRGDTADLAVGQGQTTRSQKIAVRRCSRWAASPAEPEPGGREPAHLARGGGAAKKAWGRVTYASEPRASPRAAEAGAERPSVRRCFGFLAGPELRVPFPLPKTGFTNLADVARLSLGIIG